ncbi:DUF523 domain-containing protein, partial [Bifidobacterium aquikefiri]|uniref:DUF523 domain-containing protein n=1 Tax=Bifidobacterium aquikefiri TaxID=1653207 RepID=UPI0039ED0414
MILVSACLAGFAVRYDGSDARNKLAQWLVERGQAISACPEILGGFSIPRPSAEIARGEDSRAFRRVVESTGKDVTEPYEIGAKRVLNMVKRNNITVAFLKDKSPSCGVDTIYDGSFTGVKIKGMGVTARLLASSGVKVFPDTRLIPETVRPYIDENLIPDLARFI